ncbi:general secretion pathway protein [Parapusillimonas sp. SGNA-6]|nr:general secretion pathway protein [Parapusillimonas sp. SGNA-6]
MTRPASSLSGPRWAASLRHAADCRRFSASRADYYEYLSALLQGMQGRRTLKDVFEIDARRHGNGSVRGRLSMHWLGAYQLAGGDLYATWFSAFPQNELSLIRAAQHFGNATLIRTLHELSRALLLTDAARRIMTSTLWSSALAATVLCMMLLAIPWFTLPRLLQTFAGLPPEYYGSLTRALIDLGAGVQAHWLFVVILALGGGLLFLWSLPNTSGALRRALDRHGLWRIYRTLHALRFLALLAIVLAQDEGSSTQLRPALVSQKAGLSPWLAAHVDAMLARIDAGMTGADTFDTGLLDRDQFWFLSDMIVARGLHVGLVLSAERLRTHVLGTVARQAAVLRWTLLLGCLACLMGLGLWHYAVIDELRRSLTLFYASQ